MYASTLLHVSFRSWPFVVFSGFVYCVMAMISWLYGGQTLSDIGLHFVLFIFITPGLVFALAYLFDFMDRYKIGQVANKAISCLGQYSLEIYLVHWSFICMMKQFNWHLPWIVFVVISIALAWLVKKCSDYILKLDRVRCGVR